MREEAITVFCAFTCLLLLVCSKGTNDKTAMRSKGAQPDRLEKTSASPEARERLSQFGPIQSDPKALEAWLRFTANGCYRIPTADDFRPSYSAEEQYQRSYGTGDFNRDGYYSDFAVIVIDTTRNDASRFSLIIFNRRKEGDGYAGPFWLFRDTDLSGASLTTSSHGPLLVAKQSEESTTKICVVKWIEDLEMYACDETRSTP